MVDSDNKTTVDLKSTMVDSIFSERLLREIIDTNFNTKSVINENSNVSSNDTTVSSPIFSEGLLPVLLILVAPLRGVMVA
jgi:hypothetical protein